MRRLCGIAGVSPKCYYANRKGPSRKALDDMRLVSLIRELQESHYWSLGYRKMAYLLSARLGRKINRKRVERLMNENDLLSSVRRKKYSEEIYERRREILKNKPKDLLQRNFSFPEPRKRFVEDITYLPTIEGTKYLNTIEDLFNGEIVAWAISDHPDSALSTNTVMKLAEKLGQSMEGAIIHCDEGSSYTSYAYMDLCRSLGIQVSMGKVCYDNAAMESLNGIIKTESLYCRFGKSRVRGKRVDASGIIQAAIDFISYYNEERPKEALGGMSPVQFRAANPRGIYPMVIDSSGYREEHNE